MAREQPGNLGAPVLQVAGDDRVDRAHDDARRLESHVRAVRAEVALGRGAGVRVDVDRVVRTGLHARLAADADIRVELDDPVVALIHRLRRADRNAGRVRAVVAARHLEVAARVGKLPLLDVLDPGAVDADRHLVLRLARGRARVTADALAVVDEEGVVHRVAANWSYCDRNRQLPPPQTSPPRDRDRSCRTAPAPRTTRPVPPAACSRARSRAATRCCAAACSATAPTR